jgi:hypothetical protein
VSDQPFARPCVAAGCRTSLRPDLVMCRKHWGLVPSHLRGLIRQSIAANALESTDQSRGVMQALVKRAIEAVAKAEGRLPFVL